MNPSAESHAFVLPDRDFASWLAALKPYTQHFPRVAVVRSPRGNDLNRYRNVSAITLPGMWFQDDAYAHIRRIYPQVVRVDLINVRTPSELATLAQRRISRDDRYGEKDTSPRHLFDRFVLAWPVSHYPMRITVPFHDPPRTDTNNPGVDILARPGAPVIAAAPGRVTRQWLDDKPDELNLGSYIQVTTQHDGMTYVVTYSGLRQIDQPLRAEVGVGDVLGEAASDRLRIIVQQTPGGRSGFKLPNIADPMSVIYLTGLRVRSTVPRLRVRSLPTIEAEQIGMINDTDLIEPLLNHGRTLAKVGTPEAADEWLKIKMLTGQAGYSAAWLLEAVVRGRGTGIFPGVNPVGVNLDEQHPMGKPDPSRLGGIGWLRFGYNVSMGFGSEDIRIAYERYAPLLERYVRAGYHIIVTTSHQTYGEAKGFPPWPKMSDGDWERLIDRFADMMSSIARQWAGKGLVHAWQVWNEQDMPIGAEASVPMSPANYHRMLRQVIPAMRSADSEIIALTGGHASGPGDGARYARTALSGLPAGAVPDGIAFHPYGRTARPQPDSLGHLGSIDDSIAAYEKVLPGRPMWITEWGVLNGGHADSVDVGDYALAFINRIKQRYSDRIAAMIWYAWAEGMHNGYGIVDRSGQPRPGLTERFLQS